MQLSFELEYHGWLDIKAAAQENEFLIPATFMSDVIYDCIQRVSSLIEGASGTVIVIQAEPGEYRIRIKRIEGSCTFEIYEFEDNNFCSEEIEQGNRVSYGRKPFVMQ
ncbi:hypothetical protein [Paenibacillus sp. NPDC057967]|uniref:hypothetical protein n=1 Tax=Paenibacillus sp. NPDC057967 TaxID=3346293 RepID=UPI0036D7F79C